MKSLLAAFGVDSTQWKALTLAALKLDVRTGSRGNRRDVSAAATLLIARAVLYTALGVAMAVVVAIVDDLFVAGLLVMSYVIVMVGTALLVEHNATLISPADHAILGHLPVSSRTYFAARLTNVLVYTLAATTALGWLPAGAFFLRHGFAAGTAATIAIFTCSICVTLGVVAAYLWLVRRFGARRLQRVVSYLQLVTGVFVYGGSFLLPELASSTTLSTLQLDKTPWLLLYPGAWFASYLTVATGSTGIVDVSPVLLSLAVLAFLVITLRGRLSLEYAEQLAAITTTPTPLTPRPRSSVITPTRWFRRGEARAVALLIRGHFRNDLKFRMSVLGILPITVLYLLMGLRNDDGARAEGDLGRLSLVTTAVMLFPVMLKLSMGRSDAFRASWIFFATPADRTRLVSASTHVLVTLFVLPYLVFVGLTLIWFTASWVHLAIYLLFAGMLSYVVLLAVTCVDPELPFAKPFAKDLRFIGAFIVAGLFGLLLPMFSNVLYSSMTAAAVAFALIVAISLLLGRATRARVARRATLMEFLG